MTDSILFDSPPKLAVVEQIFNLFLLQFRDWRDTEDLGRFSPTSGVKNTPVFVLTIVYIVLI